MQQGSSNLSFQGVSAWTPKVPVTHNDEHFWRKQPWSTEGSSVQLTDYAKGEESQLLPQSVHAFLERCFGSLETLENSWFSLLVMWDDKVTTSPGLTHTVLVIIAVVPTATRCTPVLTHPNGVPWAQTVPRGESLCLSALTTGKKREQRIRFVYSWGAEVETDYGLNLERTLAIESRTG